MNLRNKFTLGFGVLSLLLCVILPLGLYFSSESRAIDTLDRAGNSSALLLAESAKPALILNDTRDFERLSNQMIDIDLITRAELSYRNITKVVGIEVTEYRYSANFETDQLRDDEFDLHQNQPNPIQNATLVIYLSDKQTQRDLSSDAKKYAMLAAILVLLMGLIGSYVGFRIATPILAASRFVRKMARGDYSAQLNHGSRRDEMGQLQDGLNKLRDSMVFNKSERESQHNELLLVSQERDKTYTEILNIIGFLGSEFQSPLNSATQQIEKLINRPLSIEQETAARQLKANIIQLGHFYKEILATSRFKGASPIISRSYVNIEEILRNTISTRTEDNLVNLSTEFCDHSLSSFVLTDPIKISQLCLNLIEELKMNGGTTISIYLRSIIRTYGEQHHAEISLEFRSHDSIIETEKLMEIIEALNSTDNTSMNDFAISKNLWSSKIISTSLDSSISVRSGKNGTTYNIEFNSPYSEIKGQPVSTTSSIDIAVLNLASRNSWFNISDIDWTQPAIFSDESSAIQGISSMENDFNLVLVIASEEYLEKVIMFIDSIAQLEPKVHSVVIMNEINDSDRSLFNSPNTTLLQPPFRPYQLQSFAHSIKMKNKIKLV